MMEENPLSSRESEILELLAQGKSNKEIASDLVISVNTVKVHISNIFQKLNVSSRAEAMRFAMEEGLIESPYQEMPEPQIITEVVEAELPRWIVWLRKFWWLPLLILILIVVALSFLLSKAPFLKSATPTPDTMQTIIGQDRWQVLDSPSLARSNAALVTFRNQIFVIGGEGSSGLSTTTQSYNYRLKQWAQHNPKPNAVQNAQAILHNGKIYVFGGEGKDGKPTSFMEVYDPTEDSWTEKRNGPIALSRYAAAVLDGSIYYFGGWDGRGDSNKTYVYDPNDDSWQETTSSSFAFSDAFAVMSNGRFLIIGGKQQDEAITTMRIFSPDQNVPSKQWSEPLAIFDAKEVYGVQLMGDSIIVVSENHEGKLLMSYYSLLSETWMHTLEEKPDNFPLQPKLASISGATYFLGTSPKQDSSTSSFISYQAIYTIMIPAITN